MVAAAILDQAIKSRHAGHSAFGGLAEGDLSRFLGDLPLQVRSKDMPS